jgi:prepilin peptidase CpaA
MIWPYIGCLIFLAWACYTDIKSMKIPNKITIAFAVSGLLYRLGSGGLEGLWYGAKGFAVGFGLVFLLYCCGAVGGGDVKLFGGIGAWTGTFFAMSSLAYSILAAGLIGLVIMLARRDLIRRVTGVWRSVYGAMILKSVKPIKSSRQEMIRFPFMIAVIPGTILAYLYM